MMHHDEPSRRAERLDRLYTLDAHTHALVTFPTTLNTRATTFRDRPGRSHPAHGQLTSTVRATMPHWESADEQISYGRLLSTFKIWQRAHRLTRDVRCRESFTMHSK